MEKRNLGKSGLRVSTLVLGGNVFGWTADEATSFEILDAYVAAGGNCVDTADVYSRWAPGHKGGESETVIGNWLKKSGKRDMVVVATKVGMDMGDGKEGLKPAYIRRAVEASLQRLQTDHIDLYQAHKDDPNTPLEETLQAFAELVKAGKVRAIGASNYKGARLREALAISEKHSWPRYESLQPHYNLVHRAEYESDLEPVVLQAGIGVIPYFSLAAGFLTGKYRDPSDLKDKARAGMVGKYVNEHGLAVLKALDEVARQYGATPAQAALAWLIARPGITGPIASATSLKQLKELVAATELKLGSTAIEKLNSASQEKVVA
jgi:aryl-alcohol dehydrogenase-like predicted oxidoreductase